MAAFLAAGEVLVHRMTKKGMRDFDSRAAVLSLRGHAGEEGGAVLDLVLRHLEPAVRPDDVLSGLTSLARARRWSAYPCSPGWPRDRSTRTPARSATRCGRELSCQGGGCAILAKGRPHVDPTTFSEARLVDARPRRGPAGR